MGHDWIGDVPDELFCFPVTNTTIHAITHTTVCDHSYSLVLGKLTKKLQREIAE